MKVPGFRTGKIPPAVVIQRIGREPILDEAVRGRLTDWYMKAVDESGIAPVGDPEVDLGKLPDEGKPLTFSFEVGVRPSATLGAYRGLEVVRREPAADPEAVAGPDRRDARAHGPPGGRRPPGAERRLRDPRLRRHDRRRAVRGRRGPRPARRGRRGPPDPRLRGGPRRRRRGRAEAPSTRRSPTSTPPSTSPASRRGSSSASRRSSTRTCRCSTTSSQSDAAGYDTLDELRESIAKELLEHDVQRVEAEFRAGALDAVVARGDGRRSRSRSSRRARRSCSTACCTSSATRGSPRTPT